jgi:hypothetical protein
LHFDNIIAVKHAGFVNGGWGSNNVHPESTAFIPEELRKTYYAGGFQGGARDTYMNMAFELSKNIAADESKGIIAEWHDESHFNKYLCDKEPVALGHEYCMPEDNITKDPKILALLKDHAAIRS